MGMTSAAEAKLDARIRPDITILRSRTSYPRRHRPALAVLPGGAAVQPAAASGQAVAVVANPAGHVVPAVSAGGARTRTAAADPRLAGVTPRSVAEVPVGPVPGVTPPRSLAGVPVRGDRGAARPRSLAVAPAHSGRSATPLPMRLTRRGRVVVGALAAVATVGLAALIWLAVAGRADAAGHVRPGTPAAHSMLRVVVRPGDTLWSIAAKADPSADPRIVIQEIVDDNALHTTAITAGQVLWVPRS